MARRFIFFIILFLGCFAAGTAFACDSCACTLARSGFDPGDLKKPFFFDFTFEQQKWEKQDALAAHELHHLGHHVHNKTHEEFYYFAFGANPSESWTLLFELPYVVRSSIQVDAHRRVGQHEVSEGLGDLKATATYRFLKNENGFLGAIGGVKFPTGETRELNPVGVRFEPELQPGSGSYDYIAGLAFQGPLGSGQFHGNVLYTFRTEGDQEFRFGDAFSAYLILDAPVLARKKRELRLGADVNLQIEDKQREEGIEIADSGGTTLLIGPSANACLAPNLSIFGNILFPVYQDLGGVHQELDFVWNAGCKLTW